MIKDGNLAIESSASFCGMLLSSLHWHPFLPIFFGSLSRPQKKKHTLKAKILPISWLQYSISVLFWVGWEGGPKKTNTFFERPPPWHIILTCPVVSDIPSGSVYIAYIYIYVLPVFCLAYTLTFFLAYTLIFFLAYAVTKILTFYLAFSLNILSNILSGIPSTNPILL